ncbi:VOC family protein [Lacibacter sediminis]|uniref:VOC family protein n=1 Tax=Lacibacter sediminis TaxID=2760713 RepID=A0A7G5XCB6_9BACT|nr:VOC family protein [Lacibacter sediminis]QNA43119.1 VOC family protein [Lacibacter sediminis]
MQKITPFLWFDGNAEEAMNFYLSVFKNSKKISTMPGPGGTVMGVSFELDGLEFKGLNAGPMFKFNEAISFFVNADTQEEIDYYWNSLTADGGQESMCGWLKDKFGVSWQIVPPVLGELLSHPDREKAGRAMQAMMQMKKIIIADLQNA